MLNDFLGSIKGGLLEQLTGSAEVDSSKLDGVTDVVSDTFKDSISDKISSGGIGDIMGLFGKGGSNSSFAGSIANNVVSNLISKLGLSKGIADTIAKVAVPFIIEKFGSFAKDNGKDNEGGISDLLGDIATDSIKDKLLGGLGEKFGF